MLGIIRCRTLKCKPWSLRNLPKRDRFILADFIWVNVSWSWNGMMPRGLEEVVDRVSGEAVRGPQNKNGDAGCPAPPFSGIIRSLRQNLRRFVELRVVQVGIEAALGEQLVVRALLDDIAVADY